MSWFTTLSRSTRLAAVGGLAAGVALGAIVFVNAQSSPSPSTGAAPSASPMPGHPGPGGAMGRHRGRGPGAGDGGTITAIDGTTLTLRTLEGTETVTTSSSTTFRKEGRAIKLSDLHVNDVVRVRPAQGSQPPAQRGTGTVAAAAIQVVEPRLGGRITSIDGDTVNLVGRLGQLYTVTLTPSTRYLRGRDAADRNAVTAGAYIAAEGSRDSLTHLTADVVVVLPAPGSGGGGPRVNGSGFGGGAGAGGLGGGGGAPGGAAGGPGAGL